MGLFSRKKDQLPPPEDQELALTLSMSITDEMRYFMRMAGYGELRGSGAPTKMDRDSVFVQDGWKCRADLISAVSGKQDFADSCAAAEHWLRFAQTMTSDNKTDQVAQVLEAALSIPNGSEIQDWVESGTFPERWTAESDLSR